MQFIFHFFIFGFIGWFLDTAYRSLLRHRYTSTTVIPFFSPSYGIAGAFILLIFQATALAAPIQILLGVLSSVAIEYLSGVLCVTVLKRRLWDYSGHVLNIHGHIDLLHTSYWALCTVVLWLLTRFSV